MNACPCKTCDNGNETRSIAAHVKTWAVSACAANYASNLADVLLISCACRDFAGETRMTYRVMLFQKPHHLQPKVHRAAVHIPNANPVHRQDTPIICDRSYVRCIHCQRMHRPGTAPFRSLIHSVLPPCGKCPVSSTCARTGNPLGVTQAA